jgi:hypothetical protein
MPEYAMHLIKESPHLQISVLWANDNGALTIDPEALRPCFRKTREIFEKIKDENY